MRRAAVLSAALAALLGAVAATGRAATPPAGPAHPLAPIDMRGGNHAGFGRLVFDLPPGTRAEEVRRGDHMVVHFVPAAPLREAARAPQNVRAIATAPGLADLTLPPGARVRPMRLAGKLVIDVLDPPAPPPQRRGHRPRLALPLPPRPPALPAAQAEPAPLPAALPPALSPPAPPPPPPPPPIAAPAAPAPAAAPPATTIQAQTAPAFPAATVAPSPAPAAPVQLAAAPAALPPGMPGRAIALPFDAGVAAASFRRGDAGYAVFDQRRPIDMAALKSDPVFAAASVQLLPAATVLRVPLPPGHRLALSRTATGWRLAIRPGGPPADTPRPIRGRLAKGRMLLPAAAPGRVVSMPDPRSGALLLVGTQHAPGEAVPAARRMPEFALLRSWQGVVVAPLSDALVLRPTPLSAAAPGFVLALEGGRALALAPPSADALAAADARHFSRRFDFPDLPMPALARRLQTAIAAAAATPAQARGPRRVAVAQSMLALGMGAEAQSVLTLAATDDGRLATDPTVRGLGAFAAILAGRPDEAGGIADPRLSGSDEVALWRAIRRAMQPGGAVAAAPVLAANLPLLLAYPTALRARLLPLAAEAMARGGEAAAAQRLLAARPDDHRLDLARAMALRAQGQTALALAMFDRVAAGADRLASARAAVAAIGLRLASHALTPAQAAAAMDRQLYAWRGDDRELALREHEAALWAKAGQWRRSLALLRATTALRPDQADALHARLAATFAAAVAADARTPLPPLDLVALADENADLIAPGEPGRALAARLADRLIALDLPDRAIPVLARLAAGAPSGPARGEFGLRLARLRLSQGDAPGALDALTQSHSSGLPAPLHAARTLVFARAAAAAGDLPSATAALVALGGDAADALRADLLETAKDWPAAEAALRTLAARRIPPAGVLTDAQLTTLLRLASAAAQAGDEATLADLRQRMEARLPAGKQADMFRLLTAGPVQGVADLPRAARETQLARALPADLTSLTP